MNLKKTFAGLGSMLLGITIFLGIVVFLGVLFAGVTAVSSFLYPVLSIVASASVVVFIIAILPLSFFNKLRPVLSQISLALSYVCGVTVWMFSFLVIMITIRWAALLFLFIFHAVSPIAVIALLFQKQWVAALSIVIGLAFTYGMRFYAAWLAVSYDKSQHNEIETYVAKEPIHNSLPRYCPKCGKGYDDTWKICLHCEENLRKTKEYA